jgi:hypothetical protein
MDAIRYLPVAALVLVVVVLLWRVIAWLLRRPNRLYTRRPALLTPAELRFYQALLAAVPVGTTVFVKVRLMDIVGVAEGEWKRHGARGSGMHVDFVLADAVSTEPRLAVELDDRSHWRADAQRRDAFKNAVLVAAGVPLLRVTAAARYDVAQLRANVQSALH